MNNIYIGNRYVPVFANPVEWDNLREYEPLTIVTYQGTAYTSRQTVPVGTALSNTDYWVVTGNYNAQVEQYRQQVAALDTELDNFEDSTANNFTNVNNSITTLDNRVTSVENTIHRKYLFIGDSYAGITNPTNAWVGVACDILKATLNTDAFSYHIGGAGFVGNSQGKTFSNLLNDAHTDLASIANEITDVIVAGGCNDNDSSYTDQTINTAKSTFITNCKSYFPNARIFIACVGGFQDYQGANGMKRIRFIYNSIFSDGNVIAIANAGLPMLLNTHFADRVHPNANGIRQIGTIIGTAVKGITPLGALMCRPEALGISTWDGGLSAHSGIPYINFCSNGYIFDCGTMDLTYSEGKSVTFNNGVDLPIGKVNRGGSSFVGFTYNNSGDSNVYTIPCMIEAYATAQSKWVPLVGQMYFIYNDSDGSISVGVRAKHAFIPVEGSSFTATMFAIRHISTFISV